MTEERATLTAIARGKLPKIKAMIGIPSKMISTRKLILVHLLDLNL